MTPRASRTTRILLLLSLALGVMFLPILIEKHFVTVNLQKKATNQFTQLLKTDSHSLDDSGTLFEAQLDFENLRMNLEEKHEIEGSGLVPLITVPATTPSTSFLLVLALKSGQELTYFNQSQPTNDPAVFKELISSLPPQRGICQAIIEANNHSNVINSPEVELDGWSVLLTKKQSIYFSPHFGRIVIPTNLNVVSCQS